MALKSARHLPTLKRHVEKRATPGEQLMGRLFPGKGAGTMGVWSGDRIQQVQHMTDATYVCVHTICMKLASVVPNMAWVTDANKRIPGVTTKVCDRGLMNARGVGFNGSSHVTGTTKPYQIKTPTALESLRYGAPDDGEWFNYSRLPAKDSMIGGGGTSYLTIGEYRSKALSVVKPHQELEPLESRHLLRRLIENPNPVDTHFDYRYELLMFKLLCGVAYEWIIPNAYGKPCERWVLPSHWVWPRTGDGRYADPDDPNAHKLIQYYEVRPWGGLGSAGMLKLPPDQVVQHLFKSPINKLDGYSKLWAFSRWIDTEESISKSRWAQFINQARPEFWVEMGPNYTDPDDNMIARWEAKIAHKHQGEFNTHKPLFMPAGAKAQVLSFSPEEMVYFESMNQVFDLELVGFGLSRASVGLVTDMTFGSVLATLMSDCERCYNPLLAQEGEVETKNLAARFDEERPAWSTTTGGGYGASSEATTRRCKIWYDVLSPADPAQVNSDLQVDLQAYAVTPSEVRVLRGRKPYELGGNNPMVQGPGGIMPMPLNVQEDGDDLTDLVRSYSEAMAADKDSTKLGTQLSDEDLPKEAVTQPAAGNSQAVVAEAQDDLTSGGRIEKPNGKPSKRFAFNIHKSVGTQLRQLSDSFRDHDHATLEAKVRALLTPLDVKALKAALVEANYDYLFAGGKGRTIDNVVRTIKERKASWDRTEFKALRFKDALPGGLADRFDEQLAMGVKVEMEHTDDPAVAREIALDHLTEDPLYYSKLRQMESKRLYQQWRKRWITKQDGPHEFGCVMALLEGDARRRVLNMAAMIADEDLTDRGRENQPHITILYGLHDNDAGSIRQAVETFGTAEARLGYLDYFPSDKHDVIIIRVDSDDLHTINRDLQTLPHTDTHPTYQPHVTLAYVKPGLGQHWVDQLTAGTEDEQGTVDLPVTFTEVVFSPTEGEPTVLPIASYAAQEAGNLKEWVSNDDGGQPPTTAMNDGRTIDKGVGDTVQSAGRWLADRWQQLESRYGRSGALTMAVGMLATMPLPGNIAAVIAVAEGIRGIHGALTKDDDESEQVYRHTKNMVAKMLEAAT